ncbi:MAG: hypothetical protein LQ346_006794 [Caloplaca aetnensis]|nr:MAG: hypothetical protein LQ346_006794 [Caloplaca aetnensis]
MNQHLKEPNLFEDTDQMVQLTVMHGNRECHGRRAWPHVDLDESFEYFRNRIHHALYCKDIRSIDVPILPQGRSIVSITARWSDGSSLDRVTAMNYPEYVELQRRQEEKGLPGWLEVELGEERLAVQQEWRDRLRPLRS